MSTNCVSGFLVVCGGFSSPETYCNENLIWHDTVYIMLHDISVSGFYRFLPVAQQTQAGWWSSLALAHYAGLELWAGRKHYRSLKRHPKDDPTSPVLADAWWVKFSSWNPLQYNNLNQFDQWSQGIVRHKNKNANYDAHSESVTLQLWQYYIFYPSHSSVQVFHSLSSGSLIWIPPGILRLQRQCSLRVFFFCFGLCAVIGFAHPSCILYITPSAGWVYYNCRMDKPEACRRRTDKFL